MKFSLLFSFLGIASAAHGQLASLPLSSINDGVPVQTMGSGWESSTTLENYTSTGDANSHRLTPNQPDSQSGLVWTHALPSSVIDLKKRLDDESGRLRAMVVGETAKWKNDFGYAYSGNPSSPNSYTAFRDIEIGGNNANTAFGQYIDISLAIGAAKTFDFWFNTDLGLYPIFNSINFFPGTFSEQILWAQSAVTVNMWTPSTGSYTAVDTYLLSIEDWPIASGADLDFSDFRLALQFYDAKGSPFSTVPEPAHLATIIAALAIIGIFTRRHFLSTR